jgi:hypothetical protein
MIVKTIEAVPVDGGDRPINPVVMDSLRTTGTVLSLAQMEANKIRTAIYPNPISIESILDLYLEEAKELRIELVDMNGRVLFKTLKSCTSGKTIVPLYDLGVINLPVGSYFLSIQGENISKKLKFLIGN